MKGKYLLVHPDGWHQFIIDQAHAAEDKETVVDAYLDCLDYNWLDNSAFEKVFEAISFEESIDHVLVGHLKEQMDKHGVDSRMQMSVYYFETKGGLTTADLLTELAKDAKLPKLPNSDLFKSMVTQLCSEDLNMDKHVLQKVKEAFALVKPKLD